MRLPIPSLRPCPIPPEVGLAGNGSLPRTGGDRGSFSENAACEEKRAARHLLPRHDFRRRRSLRVRGPQRAGSHWVRTGRAFLPCHCTLWFGWQGTLRGLFFCTLSLRTSFCRCRFHRFRVPAGLGSAAGARWRLLPGDFRLRVAPLAWAPFSFPPSRPGPIAFAPPSLSWPLAGPGACGARPCHAPAPRP